jgi:hypothetical protein
MNFVTLLLDSNYGNYDYRNASNEEMGILGILLSDIGCSKNSNSIFRDWGAANKNDPHSGFSHTCSTNAVLLDEDDNGIIHVIDFIGGDDPDDIHYVPARITMTREQFVKLLDDWQEKVCKEKPKEVIIKHVDDQFIIETHT